MPLNEIDLSEDDNDDDTSISAVEKGPKGSRDRAAALGSGGSICAGGGGRVRVMSHDDE